MPSADIVPARSGGLPAYDVVIPCFNRAHVVGNAVASLLCQSHRPRRVIMVDDGSTDDSAAVLTALERQEPDVRAVLLPRNAGASAARNAGVALARAEWVAFLDSDDVWVPGAAAALTGCVQPGESDIVVGHFRRAWPDGRVDAPECGWDGGDIRTALARAGAIGPSWSLIRRSLVNDIGGFDPSFHNCNDWDFYTRAAAAGARFTRVKNVVALYDYADEGRLSHDQGSGASNARRVQAHPWFGDRQYEEEQPH